MSTDFVLPVMRNETNPKSSIRLCRSVTRPFPVALLLLFAFCLLTLSGCGAGGYVGGGALSLSSASFTIDAGQAFPVASQLQGNAPLAWSLSGPACTANGCGTLSGSTGTTVTYTAPAALTAQMKLTLMASIPGTSSSATVGITVNPDPTISGTPPPGTVGVAYSTTLVAAGGTPTLQWSIASGSLPSGLSFNTANGVIAGTPTVAGTFTFAAQIRDSSDVPFTVTAQKTIVIGGAPVAPTPVTISGNPPAGTVGVSYMTALTAAGGSAPYTWSIVAGALPAGLSLSPMSGVISGSPTAQGAATFTAQVADAVGAKASAAFSITINPAAPALQLTLSSLPGGMVGTPYAATIGVSGGTAPYACAITAGTLPSGLTLTGCTVSGTPTAAATANLTVRVTDSSSPAANTSGPVSLTIAPVAATLSLASPPPATAGTPYTGTIPVTGGTAPYACAITAGALPAGLTLNGCTITGTPTTSGSTGLTIRATDSSSPAATVTGPITLTVAPAALSLTLQSLPNGMVGAAYSSLIGVSGGTAPYACAIVSGTLPTGLALNGCLVSGFPLLPGTSNLVVRATDSSTPVGAITGPVSITITPLALTLGLGSLPNGTVGVPYSATIGVNGGVAPYSCSVTSGALPAGLALSGCVVAGTPLAAGSVTLGINAADSASPGVQVSGQVGLTINPAPLTLTLSSLPNGSVASPYNATIGVSGGTGPYACALVSGSLPLGLVLNGCAVSGLPLAPGSSSLVVRVTDARAPAATVTGPVSITIAPLTLTLGLGNLPNGTVGVPYSATIGVSGGVAPYTCSVTSGTLPAGLTLSGCVVAGTPLAAGTVSLGITATDAASPVVQVSGQVGLTINPAALSLTVSTLPGGVVGTPYSATIGVSGGTAPYACAITAGALPAGLALNGCVVSGTPTSSGTVSLTVRATDSSSPALQVSGQVALTISPAPLTLTLSSLPNGAVASPYSATIGVAGGTAPYTCTIVSGALPLGLLLNNCVVSGLPILPGTATLGVRVTDSGHPAEAVIGPVSLTITPLPLILPLGALPNGTVGVPYNATIGVNGGTAPYTCSVTGGTLPAGLTLTACTVSGTPLVAGTANLTVSVSDSANPVISTTGQVSLAILPSALTLGATTLPDGVAGDPYSATIAVTGGTGPYTCTVTSDTLPAGLTLTGCTVSGTPTAAANANLTVRATDSSTPAGTVSGPITLIIHPAVASLSLTGSAPNATLNLAYTRAFTATGGTAPYSYAVSAGTLPDGLTLSATGVLSGTPTAVGASSFTITATDSQSTPHTASLPLVLLVVYPTTPNDAELAGPYAFLFQGYDDVVAGVLAFKTATVGSFTADGTGVLQAGKLDANHQGSSPAGATVASSMFLGSYTIGTDHRGTLALTTLNADGTTGGTSVYAVALKAPVAPATAAVQADMIQFDHDQLTGTRGSGTLLAQDPAAIATGLGGTYAFGIQGDTPCLPACSIGVIAGPAAAVGQFTASGTSITGSSDVNIASATFANLALSGSYTAADANGRLPLTLTTAGMLAGVYPTDYAVYVVDSSHAFILSIDKHSQYVLLAGSIERQTLSSFSNASLSGPFIGYENAATNPGLVGTVLQNTLGLSTATIFRENGNGAGTCNTTNVDIGGLTGLVNGLTGLGSGAPVLNALLGTYQSTGNAVCTVSMNGRGVLNYPVPNTLLSILLGSLGLGATPPPARVVYLTGPGSGFFIETGYAGLGRIEPQTGQPFSSATLNGSFVFGSQPSASLAGIDSSGIFNADGAGHATTTQDLNVGVGTVNILQLGVTGTSTYTLSNATQGRYVVDGTKILYAISPNRYVLLDTNPLTTSPSISLLY